MGLLPYNSVTGICSTEAECEDSATGSRLRMQLSIYNPKTE